MNVIQLHPPGTFRTEVADRLRDQAASCRRLASVARTPRGALALAGVANQFDDDARRIARSARPTLQPLGRTLETATVIDAAALGKWVSQ